MFRSLKTYVLAVLAMLFGLIQAAHAAVPAGVTTALADIQTDALTVAGVVLVAIIAIFAFKFLRRGL